MEGLVIVAGISAIALLYALFMGYLAVFCGDCASALWWSVGVVGLLVIGADAAVLFGKKRPALVLQGVSGLIGYFASWRILH